MKENFIRAVMMFGGGYLLFYILKPKKETILKTASATKNMVSMDASVPPPNTKDAEIVADAYAQALKAGESSQKLTELNKEMTKEFGMRCYLSDSNQLVVCDTKGNTILTK